MPWVKAAIRGQAVWARVDGEGRLSVVRGRVEVLYQREGGRIYSASPANVEIQDPTVLPDDTCAPAEPKSKGRGREPSRDRATASAEPSDDPEVDGVVVAYTDGACTGNPGPAGLGVVLLADGKRVELSEYLGEGTNNIAELTAILRALEAPEGQGRPIVIHTDSQYAIGVLSKGWRAKKNVELIAALREHIKGRAEPTRLKYVPGHSGVPLNERADELARLAISTRRTSRPPR